jgi:hypothetical protein
MQFKFTSREQMADYLLAQAVAIRSRVAAASANSKHVMRAEAHAYEQSAFIVRNAVIESDRELATRLLVAKVQNLNPAVPEVGSGMLAELISLANRAELA